MIKMQSKEAAARVLIPLFIAAVVSAVVYLAWLNHAEFKKEMFGQANEQLLLIAKSEAQSIEEYLRNIYEELNILSFNSQVQDLILKKRAGYSPALEDSYRDISRITDRLFLLDEHGIVISASPYNKGQVSRDLSNYADVGAVLKNRQVYTSPVFESSGGLKFIAISQPVFSQGRFIGALRATVLIERINNLLGHINLKNKTWSVLLDQDANILSSADPDVAKDAAESLKGGKKAAGNMLVNFSPINITGGRWFIAVAARYELIAAPINANTVNNLIFTGFVLLVFFILGVWLYRTQRDKAMSAVSAKALEIINKQLHLEIDERKRMEQLFSDSLKKQDKER